MSATKVKSVKPAQKGDTCDFERGYDPVGRRVACGDPAHAIIGEKKLCRRCMQWYLKTLKVPE